MDSFALGLIRQIQTIQTARVTRPPLWIITRHSETANHLLQNIHPSHTLSEPLILTMVAGVLDPIPTVFGAVGGDCQPITGYKTYMHTNFPHLLNRHTTHLCTLGCRIATETFFGQSIVWFKWNPPWSCPYCKWFDLTLIATTNCIMCKRIKFHLKMLRDKHLRWRDLATKQPYISGSVNPFQVSQRNKCASHFRPVTS